MIAPIQLLREQPAARGPHPAEIAAAEAGCDFEIPLEPAPGVRVQRLTIASTYRKPIPVLYDANTKTAFPVTSRG